MATAVTFKSGDASTGGNNASGQLILETGKNYGSGTSDIILKTRAAGGDTSTVGATQTVLTLDTAKLATFKGRIITDDTTEATSTTDGSLQTDGGLSVAKDAIFGNDLKLLSDAAVLSLGAGSDATLTHDGTTGLTIAATPVSIDSTGELHLSSTTGDIKFQDGGTDQLSLDMDGTAGEIIMQLKVDSDDFVFKQYDGTEVFRVEDNGDFDIAGGSGSSGATFTSAGQLTTDGRILVDDTTEATSTTDGSLQTDGGLSVAKDAIFGNDLKLLSDAAVLSLGADNDATLTHDGTTGLTIAATPVSITSTGTFSLNSSTGDIKFKNTSTSGSSGAGCVLTLQTGDTVITGGNVLGQIDFQAPDEVGGTDAILVAAGIAAVSEGTFSSSNNSTKLIFRTAASDAASEKMSLSSSGKLTVTGQLDVESYAAIGNGSAIDANSGLIIDYDKTYTGVGQQLLVKGTVTGPANTSFYGASIEPESCTVPAGTTSLVASLRVKEPVITATGTLSTAATVYIEDAPTEGGNNYALLVDAGATRLDGDVTIGATGGNQVLDIASHDLVDGGLKLAGTLVTASAAELNIIDGDTSATATTVASGDRVVYNDAGTMKQVDVDDIDTYFSTTTQTLTSKTLTAPKIANAGFIADANGNEQLIFNTTASAVNHFSITNASTGNKPRLAAVGDSANIDLGLTPKGTGNVDITTGGLSIYHTDTPSTGKIYIGGNFTTTFATNATSGYIIDVVANTVTDGVTAASGTRNEFFGTRLAKPTISSTNSTVSVTKGATLYIADAPGSNANITFGTNHALHIDSGGMFVQGPSTLTGYLNVESAQGLNVGIANTNTGKLSLYSANSLNTTSITANTNATATATYTLPPSGPTNNYVLKTDGSGNLSWVSQSGGGGSTAINDLTDAVKGISNFVGSMLIGRTNTGTLSGAINNIGIGLSSSHATSGPFRSLTSGTRNVVIGSGNCGDALTEGVENTIIGNNAGSSLISGSSNVIIGGQTGTSLAGNTNAVKNVLIGHRAGVSVERGSNTIIGGGNPGITLTTGINNTCIGFGADVSSATVNNEITLGNGSVTELRCADTSITSLSDARDKTDVIDLPWGLDFVDSLRPVQFTWDRRVLTPEDENWAMNGKKRAGFLAQELQTAMTDNANDVLDLVYESNPDRLEVKMGKLVPMLTQAIKELKAEVDTLKAEVVALKNA